MKGRKVSWVGFAHETNTNQRSKWLSWMEKCIEKKATLLGKSVGQVKVEDGLVGLMKEKKRVKKEVLEKLDVAVTIGEINPWAKKKRI